MYSCEVGDDVIGEDPTINRLEQESARRLGKEAALFVPSGTFGNQCAIATHVGSADEVIVSEAAHIIQHEAGAGALLARAQMRTIPPRSGSMLTAGDIEPRIRIGDDYHCPKTSLICLEQATAYGELYPIEEMRRIHQLAASHGIPVHVDGARLFNASVALGVEAAAIAAHCDSICFCLSKGLCAPVGSVLVGTGRFIARARRVRKLMGGGMRQAGFLAAAGLVALDNMVERLAEDHENARALAAEIARIPGVTVTNDIQISMVFFRIDQDRYSEAQLHARMKERGLLTYPPENGQWRFVTHHGVTRQDVLRAAQLLADSLR